MTTETKNPSTLKNMFNDSVNFDKDISNNVGEQLKRANLETKKGTKLQKDKELIDAGLVMLRDIDPTDSKETANAKMIGFLKHFYKGHHLEKQAGYLAKKRTTMDIISQGYYIIVSKQDQYEKSVRILEEELE